MTAALRKGKHVCHFQYSLFTLCELTVLCVFQCLKITTQTCLVLCVFWWATERKEPFLDQISDGSPSKLWPLPWPQTSAQLCGGSRKSSSFRFVCFFCLYQVFSYRCHFCCDSMFSPAEVRCMTLALRQTVKKHQNLSESRTFRNWISFAVTPRWKVWHFCSVVIQHCSHNTVNDTKNVLYLKER